MAKTKRPDMVFEFGSLRIDRPKREVSISGDTIPLSQREFDILWLLASHAEEALPCDFLHNALWPHPDSEHGEEEVVACVLGLQEKLHVKANPAVSCQIVSIDTPRGKGYILKNNVE